MLFRSSAREAVDDALEEGGLDGEARRDRSGGAEDLKKELVGPRVPRETAHLLERFEEVFERHRLGFAEDAKQRLESGWFE